MENNNNLEEFSMEKFNDFAAKIKAGSPVHKINFTLECPNAVVGMYLITMEDAKSYIDKAADEADLNDDTLLVFESRHVVECCQIIYGCISILKGINLIRYNQNIIINHITNALLPAPLFYSNMVTEIDYIIDSCIDAVAFNNYDNGEKILESFNHIMKNIWFVPYGKIDEMAKEAIEEFKKNTKDGENNE